MQIERSELQMKFCVNETLAFNGLIYPRDAEIVVEYYVFWRIIYMYSDFPG